MKDDSISTFPSRKDKILDWTPMKRSKSAERRPKTPAPPADDQIHRSRANTW